MQLTGPPYLILSCYVGDSSWFSWRSKNIQSRSKSGVVDAEMSNSATNASGAEWSIDTPTLWFRITCSPASFSLCFYYSTITIPLNIARNRIICARMCFASLRLLAIYTWQISSMWLLSKQRNVISLLLSSSHILHLFLRFTRHTLSVGHLFH